MSLTWLSDNGTTWPLDGSEGVTAVDTDEGIFNVPLDLVMDQRVNADGAVLLTQRRSPRRVVLRFMLENDDGVLSLWGQFFAALAAGGTLQYAGTETRELRQVLLEGPDRSRIGRDLQYTTADEFSASFIALDPWWHGTAVTESFTFGSPTAWNEPIAWNAAIPWNGGAGVDVAIVGDAPALPLWTITGAVTDLIVSNGTQSWNWVEDLTTGNYGTVDHRPGTRSPRLGSALNGVAESSFGLWYLLSSDSQLEWSLASGDNDLIVSAAGTDGSSALDLWYEPRWLTPG